MMINKKYNEIMPNIHRETYKYLWYHDKKYLDSPSKIRNFNAVHGQAFRALRRLAALPGVDDWMR